MNDDARPDGSPAFPVVGIGASAGGLEAFSQLLKALPEQTGMAFVLVQHLDPTHQSQLGVLLSKMTRMRVLEPADGQALQPDHVYVIAPNTELSLASGGVLRVEPRPDVRGPHLPIDHFFRSLAEQRQSSAIGVVLSGTGSDGSLGLEEIKAAGGITFAQDQASAAHAGMPQSAVHSGCVDLVLPPDRIAHELVRISQHAYISPQQGAEAAAEGDDDGDFKAVLSLLRASSGVDFSAYRDTTVRRRIERRVALHGGSLGRYVEHLKGNRAELDALYQDVLINVTSFFREPAAFEALKSRAFPQILADRRPDSTIRLWVPGCSTGQEAYSLAIALLEFLDDKPVRPQICIFATDLSDSASMHKAREGLYPDSIESEVSPERRRRFFTKEDSKYRVNKALREVVVFARQNVAADPPFSRIDLLSCRNLLIYLSPALQKRVIPTFHYALNPGGFLLLGASETIGGHADLFSVVDQQHRLYSRKSTPGRPYPHFRVDDYPAGRGREAAPAPARPLPADWQREADRVAAGQYVPPGVLITDEFDILQFRGQTGPFLAPAAGDPSHNLLKMAREGLFLPLRNAVHQCKQANAVVRQPGVRVRGESVDRVIDLHVMPVRLPLAGERCYLVLFEEQSRRATLAAPPPEAPQEGSAAEAHHLRQELASTREYLQSLLEQQDAANEELRSANEEILSSNEELQSTNEELETAKEELQSVNEELITVNEQLQHRNIELARLNDDMSNLLASSGLATVVLGADLRIRRFTPAAGRLLGLQSGDVGRPIGHLRLGLEPRDIEALAGEVIERVQMQEREVRGSDGRSYLLRIHPYRTADNRIDGVVLVPFDIDDLRRVQTALQEASDYTAAIVETVREPLLVLDTQLRVQSANRAFYRMFRAAPDETVGRPLHELGNRQWDIPALREQLDKVLTKNQPFADFDIRHEFESIGVKVMRLNARRVVREGERSELILLAIEDHTEVTRLEGEAQQHLERLIELDRRRSEFLALLAHELRNPLAPMRNGLQILDRIGSPDEAQRRVRAMIERQVQRLTRLVDDLLDAARIHRGHIEVRKQRIELGALVRGAIEEARLASECKQIDLSAALPEQPMWLDGDATRLAQALGNVLNNACKFTDSGGSIVVTVERDGEQASILVRDTGVGIAADQLPHVFEMFMQADASLERTRSGLGIGLALVKQLIEAHGGTVTARSHGIGRGSEFELRLPLADGAVGPTAHPPAVEPRQSVPRRILVVDDNRDVAESLAAILQMDGHEVRVAHDGHDAVALAAAWRPEVTLLDIGLPGMSGHDVARRIREQPEGPHMLLIALTGLGQEEDRRRSAEAGIDAHLVKPVSSAQIEALLAGRR
jgi:two-component system, chemotaxis family, CheB/CheR fusion protein